MTAADNRVDALYGLALDRFVAERDALAKALRAEGDRAQAQQVRRLAKPSRAAWAVNTAVREHPDAAHALAESSRLLADAQQELLGGGDPAVLREASERARQAVEALTAAAAVSGASSGDKVRATLQAATVDADVLAEVLAGRVVRERVASGFGGFDAPTAAGGRAARPRPSPARPREQTRRLEKLRRAKQAEAEAEADLAAARRALEQVQSMVAERRAQVRAADARLRDARRRRQRAER